MLVYLIQAYLFYNKDSIINIMQQNDAELFQNHPNNHKSQLQQSLSQLKMKVSLSSYQMLQLTQHYQKFTDRLYELNQKGIQLLNSSQYESSLIYFQQAQKLLQYAASCGRTLQRHFIISILHNQATAYQKLWDFQKAISYIEAIIFNLSSIVQSADNRQLLKKLKVYASPAQNMSVFQEQEKNKFIQAQYQNIKFLISKKFNLAKYFLQFSTLNSQNQNHQNALIYAKQSQKIIFQILEASYFYLFIVERLQNKLQSKKLLQDLLSLNCQLNSNEYVKFTSQFNALKQIFDKKNLQTNSFAQLVQKYQKSKNDQSKIKQFSLGKIMELFPKSFDQKILQGQAANKYFYIQECESYTNQLQKALYLSVAYFTISVQIKQLSNEQLKQMSSKDHNMNNQIQNQQKLAEMHYILALKISIQFVPQLCHFTKYIYKNYHQTYCKGVKKSTQSLSKFDSLKQKYKFFLQQSSDELPSSLPSQKQQSIKSNQFQKQKKLVNSKQKNKLTMFFKQDNNGKSQSQIPKLDVNLSQVQSIQYGGSINFSTTLNKKFLQLHNKDKIVSFKKLDLPKSKQIREISKFSEKQSQIQQQKDEYESQNQKQKSKSKSKVKSKNKKKIKNQKSVKKQKKGNSKSVKKQSNNLKKIKSNKNISPQKKVSKSQKKIRNAQSSKRQGTIYNSKNYIINKKIGVSIDKDMKTNKIKSSKKQYQFQSMGLDSRTSFYNNNDSMKIRLLRSNELLQNKSREKSQKRGIYYRQFNQIQKSKQKQNKKGNSRQSKQRQVSKSTKKNSLSKNPKNSFKSIGLKNNHK